MNYKDAFAIGSHVEGYIKCHYAELHSPSLGKLFSLQDRNFTTKNQAVQNFNKDQGQTEYIFYGESTPTNRNAGIRTDNENLYNGHVDDMTAFVYNDIPVVEMADYVEIDETLPKAQQLVPVHLTKIAREHIIAGLKLFRQVKYKVIAEYPDGKWRYDGNEKVYIHQPGTKVVLFETYDHDEAYKHQHVTTGSASGLYYTYVEEYYPEVKPQYQALIDGINENGVFYVKPVAIDWIPTDIVNVGLDEEIEAAQKRLDAAKAILLTAAGAAVIL